MAVESIGLKIYLNDNTERLPELQSVTKLTDGTKTIDFLLDTELVSSQSIDKHCVDSHCVAYVTDRDAQCRLKSPLCPYVFILAHGLSRTVMKEAKTEGADRT